MKTIIIVPTYNERENIPELVERIFSTHVIDLHLIFVDDNSPDNTAGAIKKMAEKYPITLLTQPKKSGLGSAYILGFKKAIEMEADYIFEMDADLSHNPKDIEYMLDKANQGYNLVIGSRKITGGKIVGWNWWRHFMSKSAMYFARWFLSLKTQDVTSGFRCYHRQVLQAINLDEITSNGYAFQEEMLYLAEKKHFSICEVPVSFYDRRHGKSKLNKLDIYEFFRVMLKLKCGK
jgi:dolichol-phosphate mannosyltransferase